MTIKTKPDESDEKRIVREVEKALDELKATVEQARRDDEARFAKYDERMMLLEQRMEGLEPSAPPLPMLSISSACEVDVPGVPMLPVISVTPERTNEYVEYECKRLLGADYASFKGWVVINTRETNFTDAVNDMARATNHLPNALLIAYSAQGSWPAGYEGIALSAPVHHDTLFNIDDAITYSAGMAACPVIAFIYDRGHDAMENAFSLVPDADLYQLAASLKAAGVAVCLWSTGQYLLRQPDCPQAIRDECEAQGEPHEVYMARRIKHSMAVVKAGYNGTPAPEPFVVVPKVVTPPNLTLVPIPASGPIVLDNMKDMLVTGTMTGRADAILVNNGKLAENIVVQNFGAYDLTHSGIYIGKGKNWTLHQVTLHDNPNGSEDERALRVAECDGLNITELSIRWPGKSPIWLLKVKNVAMDGVVTTGGAWRLGIRFSDDHLGVGLCEHFISRNFVINKQSGGDANAIEAWAGCHDVQFIGGNINGGSHWLSIDNNNTGNIRWSNVHWNGNLITGWEGVRLGSMTQAEAIARGIGPL